MIVRFRRGNITETRPVHGKLDHHVSAGRKRDGFKQLHVSVEFTKYGNTLFRPVCYTARITASINPSSLNASLPKSDIEVYVLNCSVMSLCSTRKTQACQYVQTALQGVPMLQLKSCDVTCCEGDLCNDPSPSSTVPSSVPPATALFGILVLMAFTVVNVQRSGHCLME